MTTHFIAFWNLENLFGPEDHPHRIDWVQKKNARDLRGLTRAIYERKQTQLASIISQMNDGAGPDILGVCEVEDAFVLADLTALLNAALPGRDYGVVHADNERDKRGIDTAFLFDKARFTADPALIFNHFVLRRTGTRDILQATFRSPAGNPLALLCNHWPSRSDGAAESAGFRATAGETLGYWHQRIREEVGDDAAILAMGDFNDEPFDASLRFNAVAWRERGDVERGRSAQFYNLAWEYITFEATDEVGKKRLLNGTYYYAGDGNLLDQFLVGKPLLTGSAPYRLVDGSAKVETYPEMVSKSVSQGAIRFGLPKGDAARNVNLNGYSDHFPISVKLTEDVPIV